jgi:hypothetical protein
MGDDETSLRYLDLVVGPSGSAVAESRRARRLVGLAREAVRDPRGAREVYEGLLSENPGDVETHARLTALAEGFGRWDAAVGGPGCRDFLYLFYWHLLSRIF